MSYILDALRKLEQDRQHAEPLTFLTFQGQASKKRKRHRLWPYLLVVVLMLNAGVIFWWIGPWRSPGKSVNAKPTAVRGVKPAIPALFNCSGRGAEPGERRKNDRRPKGGQKAAAFNPEGDDRDRTIRCAAAVRSNKGARRRRGTCYISRSPLPASQIRAEVMPTG